MMDPLEMREAMDACRAGTDDLRLPELAPVAECLAADPAARRLFDRVQRLDRRIAEAAHDVPVPAGLAERILARIESHREEIANGSVAPAPVAVAAHRRFFRRTGLLVAIAASLLVAVSLAVVWSRPRPLTEDALRGNGETWYSQLWDRTDWMQLVPGQRERTGYPLTAAIRVNPRRVLDVSSLVGQNAVAYDLTVGGRHAALFVIPADEFDGRSTPPVAPQSNTGGHMIGYWHSRGMVYMLIVEGDERTYQNLLKPMAQPPFA